MDPGVSDDDPIEVITEEFGSDNDTLTTHRTEARWGKRRLSADELKFNADNRSMDVSGKVQYSDPQLVVRGSTAPAPLQSRSRPPASSEA